MIVRKAAWCRDRSGRLDCCLFRKRWEHIRGPDDLERDIFGNYDIVEFASLPLEVGGLFSCLALVVKPPVLVVDVRDQKGLESRLKSSFSVGNDLQSQHPSCIRYQPKQPTSFLISRQTSGLSLITLLTPHLAQFLISSRPFTVHTQRPLPSAAHSFRNRSPSAEARYSYRTEKPCTCLKKCFRASGIDMVMANRGRKGRMVDAGAMNLGWGSAHVQCM